MVILSVEQISKTLKDEPLFHGVAFGMQRGEKIGLIGPNGCGKSTFLRVIQGSLVPDEGSVAKARELTVSLLEQHPRFRSGQTVSSYLYDGDHPSIRLLRSYHTMLDRHVKESETHLHHLMDRIEQAHAWEVETRYRSLLGELQGPDPDTPMDILSGGMLKKVAIARVLAPNPDLLLLDEPTNHLDIPTIQWLEQQLCAAGVSIILVTHDRYVLDRICTSILEFDRGEVFSHPGSYRQFLQRREARLLGLQAEQERLRTVLRKELQWLSRGPKARTGKDSGRKARIEAMQDALTVEDAVQGGFTSVSSRMGRKVLELEGITKSYGDRTVIKPFSHSFNKKERIGMIGPNGSGKTTLLEMISGRVEPDGGMMDVGVNTRFGYYDQLDSPMDPSNTVLSYIESIAEEVIVGKDRSVRASRFLELFGFPPSFHRISLGLLSGGERRRLHFVGVLMQQPNFLLLDEPTNDLDIDTIRRLEEYLLEFEGTVLMVSHDRAFLDRVADTLFLFDEQGNIGKYAGSFSDREEDLVETPSVEIREQSGNGGRRDRERKLGLTFKERKELENLLEEIDAVESEIASLESEFSRTDADPSTLERRTKRYHLKQTELEGKMTRWEELAAKDEQSSN